MTIALEKQPMDILLTLRRNERVADPRAGQSMLARPGQGISFLGRRGGEKSTGGGVDLVGATVPPTQF